ncbi:MAG: gamma-glutamyltransferase [Melioribacteraceae bacterium]|nr:gamma-glutamyltransferase [Melioribacteraceae bacterium]
MLMRTYSKYLTGFVIALFINGVTYASKYPSHGSKAMVVSESSYATDVGLQILKSGGNAIDAAVAVAFTLSVTYPEAGNIGGGGFMVIHLADGRNTTIDFREKAPANAFRDMYMNDKGVFEQSLSLLGWSAAGVPGSVAGLLYAHQKYGTKPLKELIDPAINYAENGFRLDYSLSGLLNIYKKYFVKFESTAEIFVKDTLWKEGDLLVQKDLANTLKLIRDNGRSGFYSGKIVDMIVKQSESNNGYFSKEDFEKYHPVERKVVTGYYKDYKIVSMGPASSGGISLIQALNALENISITDDMWGGSYYISTLSEILKYVYANRSEHLGDIDFYPVPQEFLVSENYGKEVASRIKYRPVPSEEISAVDININEGAETTHFCVLDEFGDAVSLTTTINGLFGNKVIVDGAGFFLNNEMDDFSANPGVPNSDGLLGSQANSIQPGKRMLSSMTPSIILKDDKPVLLIGARGGSTIITTVLQSIINVIEFGMNIQEAIDAPRFHHQWMPDQIDYEKFTLSNDVKKNLVDMGFILGRERTLGKATGIQVDYKNNIIYGACDSRGDGKAAGY